MRVSLLIVDAINPRRLALKITQSASLYDVREADTAARALAQIEEAAPDLVLVSDALPDMSLPRFCKTLSSQTGKTPPPVIAISRNGIDRADLLATGVEDVLDTPVDVDLLIARMRSVLRAHAAEGEWKLRDTTSRALGFAEPVQLFQHSIPVMLIGTADHPELVRVRSALDSVSSISVSSLAPAHALDGLQSENAADVVVLPLGGRGDLLSNRALAMISDLRAYPGTRHKAILALAPENESALAARALDLGADDVMLLRPGSLFSAQDDAMEIAIRAERLQSRHQMNKTLRMTIRNRAEAALRDPLTGLYNRRYALPHLQRIAEQADTSGRPYAVMVADLDHFKQINDRYGHAAGDAVLTECARRLQTNMRAVDLLARIGGEEFLIALPMTGQSEARKAALRICKRISEHGIDVPGLSQPVHVTISIGLAVSTAQPDLFDSHCEEIGLDPAQMLKRADRALYSAKERGRNQFSLEKSAA